MENLLTRINDELNKALHRQVSRATLEFLFTPKDSLNFDAQIGCLLDENDNYLANIKAHYEYASQFDLNALFVSVELDNGKVAEVQHTMARLFDSPIANWQDTLAKIKAFVTAKMQSIKNAEVDKFNKEWSNCFK